MAEDWPEGTRTVGYTLAVTHELNQKPGKLSVLAGSSDTYSDTKHELEDRFGDFDLEPQLIRHEDTNYKDITTTRRWIRKPKPVDGAVLLGRHDLQSTRVDIGSPMAAKTAEAVRRYHDDQMLVGFYGNAYTGEYGDTAVPFTAGNIVAHGGVGITKAKLQALMKLYDDNDVDTEGEMPIVLIDNQGKVDLQNINEYVNSDYTDSRPLVTGEIKPWLGFRFIHANLLSSRAYRLGAALVIPAAGRIALPSFVPSGIHRGVWTEFFSDIGPNRSKKSQQQIYAEACSAFTRTDEKKCFQLDCAGR